MRQKPRVLVIASLGDPPYVGGIQNVVDTLVGSKLKERFDFAIMDTYRLPDPQRTRFEKALYAARLTWSCLARMRETQPDLVHIHFCSRVDFWKHSICLGVSRGCGVKTVFHLHGGAFREFLNEMTPLQVSVAKRVFRTADRVIALSSFWKEVLLRLMPPERIRVLSNPIDCARLAPEPRQTNPDRPTLLLLGRLGKNKGHYDVLKALPLVMDRFPNVLIQFAGGDDEPDATNDLKRLADELGLAQNIEFLGPVSFEPKVELLRTASMMILPSYVENMPLSILEAMAARVPVVATRVGAIPEVLDEGKVGILIDPGDWRALAQSINSLLEDPSLAESLGKLGAKKARAIWDIGHIADQLEGLYSELLQSNTSDPS